MDNRVCKKCNEEKPLDLFVKNGHLRKHICKACDSKRVVKAQQDNPDSYKARLKSWAEKNPDHVRAEGRKRSAAYRERSPERVADSKAAYRAKPESKSVEATYIRNWRAANPHKVNAMSSRRRAALLKATPAWANHFFIEEAFDLAQRRNAATGIEWEVDHIVPLRGRTVCGLHTEINLAVIPKQINRSKSNRFEG